MDQKAILDANIQQRALIYNSVEYTSTPEEKQAAVRHIDKYASDGNYKAFVDNHHNTRTVDKVWYQDEGWLDNLAHNLLAMSCFLI